MDGSQVDTQTLTPPPPTSPHPPSSSPTHSLEVLAPSGQGRRGRESAPRRPLSPRDLAGVPDGKRGHADERGEVAHDQSARRAVEAPAEGVDRDVEEDRRERGGEGGGEGGRGDDALRLEVFLDTLRMEGRRGKGRSSWVFVCLLCVCVCV